VWPFRGLCVDQSWCALTRCCLIQGIHKRMVRVK
jgi:hypothetical protein